VLRSLAFHQGRVRAVRSEGAAGVGNLRFERSDVDALTAPDESFGGGGENRTR